MKKDFFTTSRITGLLYLGLAITGVLAFLFARSKLFVEGDAQATITNFITQEGLARFGIAAELALVVFQALVAIWFFKLFKKVNSLSALAVSTFGLINAVIILIASAFWLGSLIVATQGTYIQSPTTQVETAFILFGVHEYLWIVGKLFFGLWLIPMGVSVKETKMPRLLGWTLIIGGIGYVLSLFLSILFPNFSSSNLELITVPATIGEFWMIGYLLVKKTHSNK